LCSWERGTLPSWHHSPAAAARSTALLQTQTRTQTRTRTMSGIAATLQHRRDRDRGIGSCSQAVKYLNQDFEALRRQCAESGRLFLDETFPAQGSSLGFKELGPGSYKTRGVSWERPPVSRIHLCLCVGVWVGGGGGGGNRGFESGLPGEEPVDPVL